MEYNFRKAISEKLHSKDILLSGLQKYIRRGEEEKLLYVLFELFAFTELPDDVAKALITNFVNRMRVCFAEETAGLTSPLLALQFHQFYRDFENFRGKNKAKCLLAIVKMGVALCRAKKQRLISYIKTIYFVPEAKQFALQSGDQRLISLFPTVCDFDEQVVASRYPLKGEAEEHELREIVNGILTNIKRKSDIGFYWLNKFVESIERKAVDVAKRSVDGRRQTNSPMNLMFEIYFAYARRGEGLWNRNSVKPLSQWTERMCKLLTMCYEYYQHFGLVKQGKAKSHRDWILFVCLPLLYCVRIVDFEHNVPSEINFTEQQVMELYATHRQSPARALDDYLKDQHTNEGRALKRKGEYFATVAAFVENADETLFNENYHLLYVEFKKYQDRKDNDKEESEEEQGEEQTLKKRKV